MTKVNICNFGHYDEKVRREFEDYIILVLKKFNIDVTKSKYLKRDSVNFIFEGQHGMLRKSTLRILDNSTKIKKGIVFTEVIYGINFFNKKYFTFNNKFLNKFKDNYLLSFLYLICLNLVFNISNLFKKKYWHYYQYLKVGRKNNKENIQYYFLKFFLNSFDHANGIYYWKERYNYFLEILPKIDFVINFTSAEEKYFVKIFKNYFKLEFLSTGGNKPFVENLDTKYDCLFTGQMTPYRSKILSELNKENITVKYHEYLSDKDRILEHKRSKIYLALNKFKKDNLPIGSRAWYCLENSIFFITEKTKVKNHLNEFCIELNSDNLITEIKKILNNMPNNLNKMKILLKNYNSKPFYNNHEVLKFEKFIRSL